jgi:AraC-like DNA-binding protein
MRTLRAERALALLYHEPQTSIAEVVRILRFTDRPHLTRELKAATRATPAQLRQNRDTRLGPLVDFFTFTWASF